MLGTLFIDLQWGCWGIHNQSITPAKCPDWTYYAFFSSDGWTSNRTFGTIDGNCLHWQIRSVFPSMLCTINCYNLRTFVAFIRVVINSEDDINYWQVRGLQLLRGCFELEPLSVIDQNQVDAHLTLVTIVEGVSFISVYQSFNWLIGSACIYNVEHVGKGIILIAEIIRQMKII